MTQNFLQNRKYSKRSTPAANVPWFLLKSVEKALKLFIVVQELKIELLDATALQLYSLGMTEKKTAGTGGRNSKW